MIFLKKNNLYILKKSADKFSKEEIIIKKYYEEDFRFLLGLKQNYILTKLTYKFFFWASLQISVDHRKED